MGSEGRKERLMVGTFVRDVTLPDGSCVGPGAHILKVWAVRNDGAERWPEGVGMRPTRFDFDIGGFTIDIFPEIPRKGETAEITVRFRAPEAEGHYRCWWRLVTKDGVSFGQALWLDFKVFKNGDTRVVHCKKSHQMQKREVCAGVSAAKMLPPVYLGKYPYVNCDVCKATKIDRQRRFFHCPHCRWDLCQACGEKKQAPDKKSTPKAPSSSKQIQCNKKHVMEKFTEIPKTYKGRFPCVNCDVCKDQKIDTKGYFYHCESCRFDMCQRCSAPLPSGEGEDAYVPVVGLVEKFKDAKSVSDAKCATSTDFYYYGCGMEKDKGWGCTYRVLQMILSNIAKRDGIACHVPNLKEIQQSLADAKVFPPSIVGSRDWLEPRHAAKYINYKIPMAGTGRDMNINVFSQSQRTWLMSALEAHFATGGSRTPVMIDNHVSTKAIVGVGRCKASKELLVLVFDPHVWKATDPSRITFTPAANPSARERPATTRDGRKWVSWKPLEVILNDILPGRRWMTLFVGHHLAPLRLPIPPESVTKGPDTKLSIPTKNETDLKSREKEPVIGSHVSVRTNGKWSPAVVTAIIPLDTVNSLYRVKFTGNEEEENVTLENVKVTESGLLSPGTPGSDADWVKVS